MNYNLDMKRCIEYIKMHIKEELSAEQIAGEMGYSYVFRMMRTEI